LQISSNVDIDKIYETVLENIIATILESLLDLENLGTSL
jgi:hypothetical protein